MTRKKAYFTTFPTKPTKDRCQDLDCPPIKNGVVRSEINMTYYSAGVRLSWVARPDHDFDSKNSLGLHIKKGGDYKEFIGVGVIKRKTHTPLAYENARRKWVCLSKIRKMPLGSVEMFFFFCFMLRSE